MALKVWERFGTSWLSTTRRSPHNECGSIDPRQALDKQAADTCLETVETGERREVPQDDEETLVIKDECYHEGRRSELHQK